jgi:hypothetical protein
MFSTGTSGILLFTFQALAIAVLCAIAFWKPSTGRRLFRACERYGSRLAHHKVASVWCVGIAAILIRAALLPLIPIPDPAIHDEFGHLLIADTFASGRLTNPPHPHWQHFESIYLLQQPTYTSQYPIATGLALSIGQRLFGNPWWGVVLSMGLFCALVCWMLQVWIRPTWALFAGVIAILQFNVLSYWENTYWGGAVPGIGGLLILGALARIRSGHQVRNAFLVALGLAILMNGRPVEALLFGCIICILLLWWTFKTSDLKLKPTLLTVWAPMALTLCLTLAGMLYYNYRVTGKPLELPYMLHQKLYGSPQAFWWQRPVLVNSFRHKEMRDDYLRQLRLYQRRSSPVLLAQATAGRTRDFWGFYLGPVLTIPLLFFPWAVRDRRMPLLLAVSIPFALDYLTFHAFYPHYAAPVAGIIMFVMMQSWRHLRVWRWKGKRAGLLLTRTLPLVLVGSIVMVLSARAAAILLPGSQASLELFYRDFIPTRTMRALFTERLQHIGGKHLVFVKYKQPGHNADDEWVYNQADINGAQVVWARQIDPESDQKLIDYFSDRKVWVAEPDANPPHLSPYPATPLQAVR